MLPAMSIADLKVGTTTAFHYGSIPRDART
jgi:hypothetical protein